MNVIGLILAATNTWKYPRDFTGAFILGNLLTAILMRNELFGRLLYLIVTTLFAKVRSPITYHGSLLVADTPSKVASPVVPPGMHISLTTPRWHSFGMCYIRIYVVDI